MLFLNPVLALTSKLPLFLALFEDRLLCDDFVVVRFFRDAAITSYRNFLVVSEYAVLEGDEC